MTEGPTAPREGRAAPMRIDQCMTLAPITIGADDSCVEALRLMNESNIRHLPVLDDGRLVGILTRGDIYRRSPIHPESQDPDRTSLLTSVSVAGLMTYAPSTASPAMLVSDALKVMRERKISAIPVVDDQRLVGIFTGSDGLRALDDVLAGRGD